MKLSSPPTRYAFTSVIAAAMKYGPTRVSRIAYELDMPVETCRYYLKRFHNMGFRFFPVVDYWALGLQPCVLFIRFSKKIDQTKQENIIRWLDAVYTVYRARLQSLNEHYIETVPPLNDVAKFELMMRMLMEADILDNFSLSTVKTGYYKPEWIKMYDFSKNTWSSIIEYEIPKIPLTSGTGPSDFDLTDLLITSELELDPLSKMLEISNKHRISPQLISYHREKHVEGRHLIAGYIPLRRTKHEDMQIHLIYGQDDKWGSELRQYLFKYSELEHAHVVRLHIPVQFDIQHRTHLISSYIVSEPRIYTIPTEHLDADNKWTPLEKFVEQLEKIIKVVT
jgi:hypothetical protein